MKHKYDVSLDSEKGLIVDKTNAASFLQMSKEEETALTMVLVGIIIMIGAEIALIVLKKVLCKNMTEEDMRKVVTGEILAVADAPAAAPVAETAPVEEAPAEAPVEAPVEEETTSQN